MTMVIFRSGKSGTIFSPSSVFIAWIPDASVTSETSEFNCEVDDPIESDINDVLFSLDR